MLPASFLRIGLVEGIPVSGEIGGLLLAGVSVVGIFLKVYYGDKSDKRSAEARLIDNLQETINRQDAQLAAKERRIDDLIDAEAKLAAALRDGNHATDMAVHRWRNAEQALITLIEVVRQECPDDDGTLGDILDRASVESQCRIKENKATGQGPA